MKIKLNNVRVSYVNVFKARAMNEGQTPKYSLQVIIDKGDPQVKKLNEAILDAAKKKFPAIKGNSIPARYKLPLRDGDDEREDDPNYTDKYFFNASANKRPIVLSPSKEPLTEEDGIIYSGCFCNVVINTYGFDTSGNKGVAIGLGGLQFKRDGEALGGDPTTADDFDEEESEEDDYADLI